MPAADSPPSPAPTRSAAPTEKALLRALACGDREAGSRLVERTYRQVWATQMRFTHGDAELASDLTQETYRRAWAAIATFDGRSAFATWLYRIAYTTFLNHLRRPRRVVPLEDEVAAVVPSEGEDGEAVVLRSEQGERMRRAVLGLPETLRDTVAARFWGGLAVRDIATSESVSEVAIRKRLRKAYGLLQAALEVTS